MLLFYLSLIESEENKSKFERLYYKYKNLMKYKAIEILNDEYIAEDAVHEAFIKLTRHLDGVDENNSHKTTSFLVVIVRNVCYDILRKQKHDKSFDLEEIEDIGYVSFNSFDTVELQDIYESIGSLPDKYREIIELKVYHNLSDKEISDIIGIDNANVRKRLQRAREMLKKKLVEKGEDYVSV